MTTRQPPPVVGRPTGAARPRAAALVAASAAGLGIVLVRLHETRGVDVLPVPLCPFHAVTGLWCPVCGSLRAVAALTRLDVPAALSSNLLVTLLLPVLVLAALSWAVGLVTGRPTPRLVVGNRVWVALGVVFLGFSVWRNLPGLPLAAWLAP